MNGTEIVAAPGTWVWCLGDGMEGGQNCRMMVAVRRVLRGDPAASLALGEIMPVGLVDAPQVRQMDAAGRAQFGRLSEVVGREGLFMRADMRQRPAFRFTQDIERCGGRWAMPRSAGDGRSAAVRLPLFFTCPLPLFRDEEQRAVALGLIGELVFATGRLEASWSRPEWGLQPGDEDGGDHYLAAVLRLVERLRDEWDGLMQEREPWQRAQRFFKTVRFVEQVFGATWVTIRETRGVHGDDGERNGYLLSFARTGVDGDDEAKLAAEIDIRGDWMRGLIVGINQGRESYAQGLVVNGAIVPVVRLIDPWQLVYHNLTSAITDAQRLWMEMEPAREMAAMEGGGPADGAVSYGL